MSPSFVQRFRVWNGSCSWVWSLRYAYALTRSNATDTETLSGVSELLIFHPVDTIAKRLMSNKAKVLPQPSSQWDPDLPH
jgi:hypothetical protein